MFARIVTALMKPNHIARFSLLLEREVLLMLRELHGFRELLAFFSTWCGRDNGDQFVGLSFARGNLWPTSSKALRRSIPAKL
jgi:hypothetical protein